MLDFVPLIGDMKGFIEAQSPFDYMLAAVGTLGPVGDGVKLMLKEAKLLAEAGDTAKAAEKLNQVKGDLHHICTNKNGISTASGGPWTPEYTKIFDGAGLDINKSLDNLVNVPGHKGPHPQAYHEYVYKQLDDATTGLSKGTQAYTDAVKAALAKLKIEATTPSNQVNNWLTKK
jgi:filamentous hemagglutinin